MLIWKHGDQIVAIGSQVMDKSRVNLEQSKNGNTLVISLAETSDAGDYICQISAYKPVELKHNVKVRGKRRSEFLINSTRIMMEGERRRRTLRD